jgi:hypothetical protein
MTMSTLHGTIQHLASQFAAGVLDAIRGASLEDILSETGGSGGGRRAGRSALPVVFPAGAAASRRKGGRLPRRSPKDIAKVVESIVTLLSGKPNGLRAEQIRAELNLEAKELPRPISEALASHKISKRGQKRATTYFTKSGGRAAPAKAGRAPRRAAGKAAKRSKPSRPAKRGGKKPVAANAHAVNGAPSAA